MAIGQYKEIKGLGQTEIIDMPIYQVLSKSKNTQIIGKLIDSQYKNPLQNMTVTASMTGYNCGKRQILAEENGVF